MRSLLGHRDFRLLFLGQGLSTIGDRIVFVALALYVTDIGTPSDVGVVLACHAVPLVGFLLIGGVWADRLPRHLVVVTTDDVAAHPHAPGLHLREQAARAADLDALRDLEPLDGFARLEIGEQRACRRAGRGILVVQLAREGARGRRRRRPRPGRG